MKKETDTSSVQHVFIVGSKGLGNYGGYETFVDRLTGCHADNPNIRYHIACKANGDGMMDERTLNGATTTGETEFEYHNAHCFKISVPNIGPAVAVYYDIAALKYCIAYCRENKIPHPVFYVLACRIGPFIGALKRQIRALGGRLYVNPDGWEFKRQKWNAAIRRYWKFSEKLMVRHADLMVCDSVNIEKYILSEYSGFHPRTTFIAYGSDTAPSRLADDDAAFAGWLADRGLRPKEYYLVVGRFVPENNFETMIREFMKSRSRRDLAIITTANDKFLAALEERLHFRSDKRVKFVGTVYDQALLRKIRENAYGYFHGHEVGGTNPSLLEALGATDLNLLLDVGFNREVGEDSALYWSKAGGDLAALIDRADAMSDEARAELGRRAKERIRTAYSWDYIAGRYEALWRA